MKLALITINYNDAESTIAFLQSLERQTDQDFTVYVVDNASEPSDQDKLRSYIASSRLPLQVIWNPQNTGYAGGNNVAIRQALAQGSDWVLLINSDTTVAEDFIAHIRNRLSTEQPALIGLSLAEGDRIVNAGHIHWLATSLAHERIQTIERSTPPYAYVVGAALLVHRDILARIGMMDESYFIYFEDAEYTLRARRAGAPVRFWEMPHVTHAVSHATSKLGSPLMLRYHTRNALRFNMRNGSWYIKLATPLWGMWIAGKQIIKLILRRAAPQSRAILAGVRDALFGRFGYIDPRPLIAIECESLEDTSWGVARMTRGLLEEINMHPTEWSTFRIRCYFKRRVPEDIAAMANIETTIVRPSRWIPISFSLYYYAWLPLRLWWDRPTITYWPNYMLPIIAPHAALVTLTEDVWYESRNRANKFVHRLGYTIFCGWAARFARHINVFSHASAAGVSKLYHITPTRIFVNQLGVAAPVPAQPYPGRYLLYVGQGLPRRHLRETIQAFRVLASENPDLRLIAIGPDKYQPNIIRELVRDTNEALGRPAVHWQERVSDAELASLYQGAIACVYVSDVEAFGLPPLEALSRGVPPIVLDTPINRELYGDSALFVGQPTIEAIATAMRRVLIDQDLRSTIRAEAPNILQRYTWHAHAMRFRAFLTSIL